MNTLTTHLNTQLLRAGERLVEDYTEVPAGSVLRCYSRAVLQLRSCGTPWRRLPRESEALARDRLTERIAGRPVLS